MSVPSENATAPSESIRDLLGYLNFSDGTPGPRFRQCMNLLYGREPQSTNSIRNSLLDQLSKLQQEGATAFTEITQAESVIKTAFDHVLPAYISHHRDLLFHLFEDYSPDEPGILAQPFLLAHILEATLASWSSQPSDLTDSVLRRLNSYVGYRPVAVLENERRMEVYDHERYCPIPLYLRNSGVAAGRFEPLISATLEFLKRLPEDLTGPAHFSLDRLDELALDIRAHDHLHPVNKRTNYMFGEWDPEVIDVKGFYRRFVVRSIIIESLQSWMETTDTMAPEERLYDASAVLAGTILMASSISGSGPDTYDSSVSLTALLPMVARQRDKFYQSLLDTSSGERRERLTTSALESRQPFGHVRHQLNMYLSQYGASQVQHRQLASFYASLGFEEAACAEASIIPCASARFESEILSRVMLIHRSLRNKEIDQARQLLTDCFDLLRRGIHCGAVVDPWNVLGFQGMFPLFSAREDAIPDNRVEVLVEVVEHMFDASSAIMAESAALGRSDIHQSVETDFTSLSEEWDTYATTTVAEIPHVSGGESLRAARHVSAALAEWRTAGESAGDISFWRQHVSQFESPRSFSQVVSALLDRNDVVAATGLLMQWLSEAEEMGLESGRHSIHQQLHRLLRTIITRPKDEQWPRLQRLFAYMEANAGLYWQVPSLKEFVNRYRSGKSNGNGKDESLDFDHLFDADSSEFGDDSEENLFQAAYEDVVFRDSADDGIEGDTVDDGYGIGTTEFEVIYRQIEPRLRFLHTLGALFGSAAVSLSQNSSLAPDNEQREYLRQWLASIRGFLKDLAGLISEVREHEIKSLSADLDANIEFDLQMQSRFLLMQNTISTTVEFLMAERLVCAALMDGESLPGAGRDFDRQLVVMLRAVLCNDIQKVRAEFSEFTEALQKRPLLYVPFEHGGQPAGILKARTLQAVFRMLLSQLPRLGLLKETFRLLEAAYRMERSSRPLGQAVTEFDRLFRIGLACSAESILHAARRWKTETSQQRRAVFRRLQRLLDAYSGLWIRHSSSMRLSVVEELNDPERSDDIRQFIETYGEDLFHTRMLTLGNARAIVQHGADSLLDELENTVATFQPCRIVDDIRASKLDREEAIEMMEFVYESVVDNFDRFLEYNTTTTHSDYGNRLFCLLDFLKLEADYERLSWNHIPWKVVHESAVRLNSDELAAELETELREMTRQVAENMVDDLQELESRYGVQLPTLHDHIHERIAGALAVNRMRARVGRCSPGLGDISEDDARVNFAVLRQEISDFMEGRLGSNIEPPEWMQSLGREFERVHEEHEGLVSESLTNVAYQRVTQREIDRQLSQLNEPDEA